MPEELACGSIHGWSFSTDVWTIREFEDGDDDSLEKAKRDGRRWVENECQRQAIQMNKERERWEAESQCEQGCVKVITESVPVSGPIKVSFRILGVGKVRCLATLTARATISCEEPSREKRRRSF
jgi:hypothetical protein